jgi:hypothetical protein
MDLENDVLFNKLMNQSKLTSKDDSKTPKVDHGNVIPLYISMSKKMKKATDKFENLQQMSESHNRIILKNESLIKDMMAISVYEVKNVTFKNEIETRVNTMLYSFNETLNKQLDLKINADEFYNKVRCKANMKVVSGLQLELSQQKEMIKRNKVALERKVDGEDQIPTPTLEEIARLDEQKASKIEVEQLRQEISRLEIIINRVDRGYSEGEGFSSRYEGEESEEEVLSLDNIDEVQKPTEDNEEPPKEEISLETPKEETKNEDLTQNKLGDIIEVVKEKAMFSKTVKIDIKLEKDPTVRFLTQ